MAGHDSRESSDVPADALARVADGVVALDADFRYTYVNDRAERLLGRSADDLLGEAVWDSFPDAIDPVDETALRSAFESGERRTFERHHAALDCWFEVRVHPGPDGLTLHFYDVTERHEAERELERSRRRLRVLFDESPDAITVHDADGTIVDVNDQTVADLGYDREELLSMHVSDVEVDVPREELMTVWEELDVGEGMEAEGEHRRADGSTFPVEVWFRKIEVGGEVRFVALSRDITERKERERELRMLTEEYEAILANAPDTIFLVDVDRDDGAVEFRYERVNDVEADSIGLTSAEIRGKTPREAFGPDVGATVADHYRECVEAAAPVSYEERLDLPTGERVRQTNLAPVVVDGTVTRLVGVSRDVTDRVEQERELRRRNERLDEFASVISHDLRNPLNVAQGRAALLESEFESPHLDSLCAALDRMEAIVADTLTLARKGETVTDPEVVDLGDLLDRCWGMVDTASATLEVVDDLVVLGDPSRLRNVFENLFRNAVEHGGADVTVRVGRLDDGQGIYVEDDGRGIPDDERDSVLDPGYTSRDHGTGFGLTIVRRIAEAHGWTVSLAEGSAGGARFEFTGVEFA